MKKSFVKNQGRMTENLEIGIEDKWFYLEYKKGNYEKTSCILKSEEKKIEQQINLFLDENKVSAEMKKEVNKFLKSESLNSGKQWREFTDFLIKMLSLHIVFGVTIGFAIFLGYKLGDKADSVLGYYPLFTLIGVFTGIGIGGLTAYSMAVKYFKPQKTAKFKKMKQKKKANKVIEKNWPEINVSINDVREAVRTFSEELPKGVYRTILVKDDYSIDFQQLAHILGGIPSHKFYMSKETYDIFEESEKEIPPLMDLIQKAVDQYEKEHKTYPMLKFDPLRRVNYFVLNQEHYLSFLPDIPFYITDCDGLVTHIKPKKKIQDH